MNKSIISVTVITLNEQENIARCLESVTTFADEIIVVDCGSTDKTIEIAKRYGAKVYKRPFDDFSSQKNFASQKSKGDWIFAIDADETATPELAWEIRKAVKRTDVNGYSIPRRNILLGAEIKHTRWSPDRHIWLFRKSQAKWVGRIHEEVMVKGSVKKLNSAKMHYHYKTVREFIEMMNIYTDKMAYELISKGQKFSLFYLLWAPTLSFFRRFFYKRGYLDGWRGFVLSYLMAIYRMTTWVKVWEKGKIK